MATLKLEARYEIYSDTPITLPDGKTPDDIKDVSMKYGHVIITFEDGSTMEGVEECDLDLETIDYKYPSQIRLYSVENETHDLVYEN